MKIAALLALSLMLVAGAWTGAAHAQDQGEAQARANPDLPPTPPEVVAARQAAAARAEANAEFLAGNALEPDVNTLPSGLQYKVLKAGPANGPSPKLGDAVKVHYEGALINGQVFDSTLGGKPFLMILANVIPGWIEALQLMKVGDDWIIYVPPALGYGERDTGLIPPNSILVFRLQLLAMLAAD